MDTLSAYTPFLHVPQACLSAYTIYLSSITVPKLQQYEESSEKAARYSNTAEHQLHKTRTTQTSGALTTSFSLLTSITMTALPHYLPPWSKALLSIANFGSCIFAYTHIHNFWRGKAKVPFVTDYNDAITLTNQMSTYLAYLAGSWAVSALVHFGGLMGALGEGTGVHREL